MNDLLFYIIVAIFALSVGYLLKRNPQAKEFADKVKNEIYESREMLKSFLPDEVYEEIEQMIIREIKNETDKLIKEYNEKYGTNFKHIDTVLLDKTLRLVNGNGKYNFITTEQARFAIKVIRNIVEYKMKQ